MLKRALQKGQRDVIQLGQFGRRLISQQVMRHTVEEVRLVRHALAREVGGQLLGLLKRHDLVVAAVHQQQGWQATAEVIARRVAPVALGRNIGRAKRNQRLVEAKRRYEAALLEARSEERRVGKA